jgi:hypothetical protein
MSAIPLSETDAAIVKAWSGVGIYPALVPAEFCRQLERERDEARTALMEIEEIFVDGSDTYEDWKSMGTIARKFLSENATAQTPPDSGTKIL